jgi:hypothetical protein
MTYAAQRGVSTTQPTCRLRARPTTTGPKLCSLEITYASRLRRKLRGDGDGDAKLVVNVWGVGLRLIDGPLHQPGEQAAGR